MSNLKFHFYLTDINLLNKSRQLIKHFNENAEIHIYENRDEIPKDICGEIIIINDELDFFNTHFSHEDQQNTLIVFNDVLDDIDDYPAEIYISKNKVLTTMSAVLYDLSNDDAFNSKYFAVKIDNIVTGELAPCDLYLKITSEKFLKCFNQNENFDIASSNRFKAKSPFLYVEKGDFYLYGDFLYGQNDLERKISSDFDMSQVAHLGLIHDMAKNCGISEKTLRTVSGSINHINEGASKKIKTLLKRFDQIEGTYLYAHSYFASLVVIEVASKFSWFKQSHIEKLVLASLLHDLGYKDEKNAICEILGRSKVLELSPENQKDVLGHIDNLLEILTKDNEIDSDVLTIIKSHHGARGDESYPLKSYATEMDLLSGIFLLSHVFTICLFRFSFNLEKLDMILSYMELTYNKGNLRTILPEFNKHVKALF